MRAYILITARHGTADKLAETIRKVKSVTSSECVYGRFDVIAIVQSPEMKTLSRIVNQIQKYPQILHTETAFSHHMDEEESQGIAE